MTLKCTVGGNRKTRIINIYISHLHFGYIKISISHQIWKNVWIKASLFSSIKSDQNQLFLSSHLVELKCLEKVSINPIVLCSSWLRIMGWTSLRQVPSPTIISQRWGERKTQKRPDRTLEERMTPPLPLFQTFTRLAERVLAANKKDLDLLRMSLNDELNLAALEEEEGLRDGAAGDQQKQCWC